MDEPVRIERLGAAWVLTVDRPRSRNAVDVAVHDALVAAIDEAEAEAGADGGPRALVLTGGGGTFLSGGDLRVIRDEPFEATLELCRRMTALLDRIEASPLPVLAAIEGHCFGGGCEVMVACDYRIAAAESQLSFRQAAMGVSTGWGGAARLSRLVPRGTATRLLLGAEVLRGEQMRALGVVDEVSVAPRARCLALAETIAAHEPEVVAGLLRVIRAAYAGGEAGREVEREVFAELWGGAAHRAALDAYFERQGSGG